MRWIGFKEKICMKILVVTKSPGEKAKSVSIDNNLKSFQKLLNGGYLQALPRAAFPDLKEYIVYCDEDGYAKELPFHFSLFQGTDAVVGSTIVSKVNNDGDSVSLSDDEVSTICKYLDSLTGV